MRRFPLRAIVLLSFLFASCGDGIETNINPEFALAGELEPGPDDLVIGLVLGDEVRAYPIAHMAPIEILNDRVGGQAIAITWCPLSGSGVVFSSVVDGEALTFRFHPDLYKRNLIVEDVETGSQWNQLERGGIKGRLRDSSLRLIPSLQTTYGVWKELHPDTKVMRPTWGEHPYTYRPEGTPDRDGLADRSLVYVVFGQGEVKVFPLQDLAARGTTLEERVGGMDVRVNYLPQGPTAFAETPDGEMVPGITLYRRYIPELYPDAVYWRYQDPIGPR